MTWMLNQELEKLGISVLDLTAESLLKDDFDLMHLHFFEGYMGFKNPLRLYKRMSSLLKGIDRQRKRGAKLIYTAHNVVTHDAPWRSLENWYLSQFMRRVDGTIFVSEVSKPLVHKMFPMLGGPNTVIPLSDYGDWYKVTMTPAQARAEFGIPASSLVVAHVGLIRQYKNVPGLIQAFSAIPGDQRLLIGGRVVEAELKTEIEALTALDSRVHLELGHLEDDRIQVFMLAADVAVFPYRNILNSGSAMMALTFGKPVVVPNVGSMPELQERVNSDWVRVYDGDFGQSELDASMAWARDTARGHIPPLDELSVPAIAEQHAQFYRKVLSGSA